MNLLMSNPIFDGSNLIMPVVPAFEYIVMLNNVETRGVVLLRLALNGNSAICGGFSTLTNRLQPLLGLRRTPK